MDTKLIIPLIRWSVSGTVNIIVISMGAGVLVKALFAELSVPTPRNRA